MNYDLSTINEVNEDDVVIFYEYPLLLRPTTSFDKDEYEDDNNTSVLIHEYDADDDNTSTHLYGGVVNTSSDCALEREAFDDLLNRGIPDAFGGYDSEDSFIAGR